MKNKPRYWVCIIGPVSDDKLPDGADLPPRRAALEAICNMISDGHLNCNSGWHDEDEYNRIMAAKYPGLAHEYK